MSKISLRKAAQPEPDEIPEGWMTTKQWAEYEGLCPNQTCALIRRLVEEGKWETQRFRIAYPGFTRAVPHYRPKP